MSILSNMSTEAIITTTSRLLKDIPLAQEDFIQAAAAATSRTALINTVLEFVPETSF